MTFLQKLSKISFFAIAFSSLVQLASLFKVSFIWGSFRGFLSTTTMITPLAGAFGGGLGVFGVGCMRLALHILLFGKISILFLTNFAPGMAGGLYWSSRSIIIRFGVPLACMMLFIAHPVGGQAFLYSFYWLVPMALYFVKEKNCFLEALGSTLTAHAVGSTIWLYCLPATPAFWIALIPVVFVERLVFAGGMAVAYKVITYLFEALKEKVTQRIGFAKNC